MATVTLSPQQSAVIARTKLRTGGSLIVIAVAGAGKTFTLVKAVEEMEGSVFIGAYNTKMAKELRERVAHLTNVRAGTFHSAGMNALRRAIEIKGDPDSYKVSNLTEAWIVEKGRLDLTDLVPTVAKVVSMAKQRGIGALEDFPDCVTTWRDMIDHFGLDEDLPEDEREYEKTVEQVIHMSRLMLRKSNEVARSEGIIDFDDMVYLPLAFNLRMWQNDWVLIDEAQDTNPTRRALARKMLRPGRGRLIAVGDPRQAIYGFSGADNDALDQIKRDFGATELPLTVTYRCPKSVVEVAQQFVSHIEAADTAPEGAVDSIQYDQLLETVKPGEAILCRYNKYLVGACFKLIRNGVAARIEGRAIGANLIALVSKWKVKTLDGLQGRVTKWMEREVAKAEAKKQDAKADQVRDRGETVLVLIERGYEQGVKNVAELKTMIEGLFDDRVVDKKNMVTLCSVHRSKGLEWDTVYILGLYELMGRQCRQDWQTEQEVNLQYVAATRAQKRLVLVNGVKEERKEKN